MANNRVSKVKSISSTALVIAGPVYLLSLHITATATATALIQDTAAGGGTDIMKLGCVANGADNWVAGAAAGVYFANGIYATLAGAGIILTTEYIGTV